VWRGIAGLPPITLIYSHNSAEHDTDYHQSLIVSSVANGVGTNFGVGVGEARPEPPRAGDGVLGEGAASPSPPARGFAEAL